MLESLHVSSVRPYGVRPYEWVVGVATFAVDPADPANARIVDLPLAPRDQDGKVRFESDVRLLRPTGSGNGRALVTVPNRGMLGVLPLSADAAFAVDTHQAPEAGDGFLLDDGWTLAWCGWQWDVLRQQGGLGLDAPRAEVTPGWLRVEFRLDTAEAHHALGDSSSFFQFASYPTANLEDPEAFLTIRSSPLGEKRTVPRDHWRFTDETHFEVDGGFQPFHWYELVYRSVFAPVVGTGLLGVRDFAASLQDSNDHVFAFGVSQSGRFLREFLFDGLNLDERGRQVFDGVLAHVASARRGEFNRRYGQPSLTHPLTPGYGPPYDNAGMLERQRASGGVPKLILTNSSWEYWRGDAALVHQHPHTGADLPEDPDVRAHLLAGTDHWGPFPIKDLLPVANPVHHRDETPVLRALFVQLVEWVCDGVAPTPSCVPRLSDGTAVERSEVLSVFHDCALPDPEHLPWTPAIDPGSTSWPLELGEPMVALVSAVDSTGNEVAGIRLPEVAVPLAAYTGWNPRVHIDGLPDVLHEMSGSRLPLPSAVTMPDRTTHERAARAAAKALVAARFLLDRDIERTVRAATAAYDEREHSEQERAAVDDSN